MFCGVPVGRMCEHGIIGAVAPTSYRRQGRPAAQEPCRGYPS